MNRFCLIHGFMFVIFLSFVSCGLKDKKTTMEIKDPLRHYYPVLRGQELDIVYEVNNTGENPLFITDIQTSCGCLLLDESSIKVLPVGGKGFIRLKYNSSKNVGYVKHYITVFANLLDSDKHEVTFDLNVVPNALYTRDYEELYGQYKEKNGNGYKTLVDGKENEKGYYTDIP